MYATMSAEPASENPSKTRVVPAGPSTVDLAPLLAKIEALEAELTALKLGGPPQPPRYPDLLSKAALDMLSKDPRLPDFIRPAVTMVEHCSFSIIDDRSHQLAQDCYATLIGWIQTQPLPEATAPPAAGPGPRSRSAGRDRFVVHDGKPFYRSSQGKLWDTTQAPPYPCRRCRCLHWNWTPCPRPQPIPGPSGYFYGPPPTPSKAGYYPVPSFVGPSQPPNGPAGEPLALH